LTGVLSLGIKQPDCEADNPPPSAVSRGMVIPSIPHTFSWCGNEIRTGIILLYLFHTI